MRCALSVSNSSARWGMRPPCPAFRSTTGSVDSKLRPNSSFMSITSALISVESASAMSCRMRRGLCDAQRFTYNARTIVVSSSDTGRAAAAGPACAESVGQRAASPHAADTATNHKVFRMDDRCSARPNGEQRPCPPHLHNVRRAARSRHTLYLHARCMTVPLCPTTRRLRPRTRVRVTSVFVAGLACAIATACHRPKPNPPTADFLLFAADSTFWIHSGPQGIHARGSPIQLARYGGKYYEVYVADDDRSYTDAEIVGQQVWRRDILSGDSSLVFRDTTIEGIEHWYARTHPDDHPLGPNDDSDDDDPRVSATSELDLLDQLGPYVSYEYRADLTLDAGDEWHIARRGVLDLRRARDVSVRDLFGDTTARTLISKGRVLFGQALDSVLAS